jgi:hypothetical protein
MNAFVPMINRFAKEPRYGSKAEKKKKELEPVMK